jgi:hypothetical protein
MLDIERIKDIKKEAIIILLALKGSIYFNANVKISIDTIKTSDNIISKKFFIFLFF